MNEILEGLHARKSVRVYTGAPICRADRAAILQAAAAAPTAGCQQLYTILDIRDEALKRKLALSCDNQPFIAKGEMVLVFCADCKKWQDAYRAAGCSPRAPGVGDLMLAVCDAVAAAQNAVTAAESLGIGSCYIGDIMERREEQRALLHLPRYVFPAAMLVLGYPTEQQKQRTKPPRFPMEHIVHENTYRDMDEGELRAMFAGRTGGDSFEHFLTAFCERKYNSEFSREMTRSVAEYLTEYTEYRGD